MMSKVYSYARWSSPEQAKGDSFRRQSDAAAKWAWAKGLVLDEKLSFRDEGVSAYRGGNAGEDAGLGSFLFACKRGLIEPGSYLLVESLDRISRMVARRAQRIIEDIVEAGVTIVTLSDGQEYTLDRLDNDPTAFIISYMVASRAHDESKTKGRRVAAAWEAKRAALRAGSTKRFTLRAPSWLIPDGEGWAVDPERGEVLRRIYTLTIAGAGEHRIARLLNDEGVKPFGSAKQWHRSAISKFLRSPAVIGTLTPGHLEFTGNVKKRVTEAPVADAFPPAVPHSDWLAVRALKDGSAASVRGRHAAAGVAHILAGLARCPLCSGTMVRVSKGSGGRGGLPKLVCGAAKTGVGCSYNSVPVHLVEEALLNGWSRMFENVPAGDDDASLDREYEAQAGTIAGTEVHLLDLADALERAPSAAGAVRLQRVEAELRTMRADLATLDERREMADRGVIRTRLGDLGGLFQAVDDGGDIDRPAINAGLKTLFKSATVDFVTGYLRLNWRQGGEASLLYAWVD